MSEIPSNRKISGFHIGMVQSLKIFITVATNDFFLKLLITGVSEISHFVRNDGESPYDGGWKSGGWSLSEVEVAATFPPTDDTNGVSFRPTGEISFFTASSRNLIFSLLTIPLLFLSSCLKEKPIERITNGELQTIQVNMGETYQMQIFYDLENLEIIDTKDKDAWDLAFSGSDTSNHVILNTAKIMGAAFIPNASLTDNLSTSGVTWVYEHHEGDSELSPFYGWENKVGVYLINGGFNHLGQNQPNHALQLKLVNGALEVQYRRLNQQEIRTVMIPKMSNYNYYALNFANQALHECEPPKNTWDIVFTVYTHIFDDNHAYAVNGVLLNRNRVEAAKISGNLEEFSFEEALSFPLSNNLDVIGYDWKSFNMQAGLFSIVPNFFYLVQSRNSVRHKIRFVNFYSDQGIRGFPTFEIGGI